MTHSGTQNISKDLTGVPCQAWWSLTRIKKGRRLGPQTTDFSSTGCDKCHLVETPMNQDSGSGWQYYCKPFSPTPNAHLHSTHQLSCPPAALLFLAAGNAFLYLSVWLRPQGTCCPVGPFLVIPARIPFSLYSFCTFTEFVFFVINWTYLKCTVSSVLLYVYILPSVTIDSFWFSGISYK